MSVARNYFGDRGRERPAFNYRRNDRNFNTNVPTSRHSIFIRGFPASVSVKTIKNYFVDETRSNVLIDFVSYTDEHKKLCVAVRFDSTQVAREMFTKYNNRELLGHTVEFSWFKDMNSIKGKCELVNDRRFRGSYNNSTNNNNNRPPRRFIERRSRSKQRYRENFEKRRDYKSHSRSRDSESSSSYSKSRSGSDSISDRSSASPTRLIRNINKEKYKRRHDSGDSTTSVDRSKERNETKSDIEKDSKKRKRNRSRKPSGEISKLDKSLSVDTAERKGDVFEKEGGSHRRSNVSELDVSKVKLKSAELLEDYSKDVEKYLSVINVLIGKNADYEAPLVGSLKDILTEVGDKYVNQFITFIEAIPNEIAAN